MIFLLKTIIMRKLLLYLMTFVLFSANLQAQRDTEHWIAPYYANTTGYNHGLYFSTDSTVPITVEVYHNNAVVHTVNNLTKGNPQVWILSTLLASQYLYSNTAAEALTVINKGLYIKAQNDIPFFVSLRMYQGAHSEFLTSKGKAGIGTLFYAAPAPLTYNSSSMNFTTGIMATEDNTTITVDGYNPGVRFTNGPTTSPPSYTFTMNKGQSVLFSGQANHAPNQQGFIGAKIVADKPVNVTNGNANGMFGTSNTTSGSDLIMDQSVPKEKLGKTFAMVRSLTYLGDPNNMEGGLIVATEDNTQIFLNDGVAAVATINAGEHYRILSNHYVNQGGSGHYNMYISTTKDVYLYQLLGTGSTTSGSNTGGYNYIPPLSCYLPRSIDEIGNIHQMPGMTGTADLKLNIITEAGAVVTVTSNNNPIIPQGPYAVSGNPTWVTYEVPGITGNLAITSTKAVTAGINGGWSTGGWGGYFAGFSSRPIIEKQTGECIPGMVIGVDDIYETYQWFLNGTPIPGANTHTLTPTTPGEYTLTVSIQGCNPVTTEIFKVFPCYTNTTITGNVCGSKTYQVEFTNSTQTLDPASITITIPPANGTAMIDTATNTITYTPNVGYLGPDTFTYEFNSDVPIFFDKEIVKVDVNVVLLETYEDSLTACPYNGVATYDLTTVDVTAFATNPTFQFYPTLTDAENQTNEIVYPNAYVSASGSAFVRVTTPEGCFEFAKINLFFYDQPVVNDAVLSSCFIPENPTTAEFDLTTANVGALPGVPVKYYPSMADAENNTNEIQNPFVYVSPTSAAYVRVFTENGCYSIAKISLNVIQPNYSTVLVDKIICIEGRTTLDAGPGFQSYLWSTGATTQEITGVGVGEYWVILYSEGCPTIQTVKVHKAPEVVISNIEINNNTVTLTVLGGEQPYQYSLDGITWQDSNVFTDLPRGQNIFYVKDSFNCTPVMVEVTVPNLVNAITPNEDGVNDVLDYSALRYKENLTLSIYDRYGNRVHVADKNNNYMWDGRFGNKRVSTGTYWYHISWNEPDAAKTPVKHTGWVMVKNIE